MLLLTELFPPLFLFDAGAMMIWFWQEEWLKKIQGESRKEKHTSISHHHCGLITESARDQKQMLPLIWLFATCIDIIALDCQHLHVDMHVFGYLLVVSKTFMIAFMMRGALSLTVCPTSSIIGGAPVSNPVQSQFSQPASDWTDFGVFEIRFYLFC